jgi:hypothetical protein
VDEGRGEGALAVRVDEHHLRQAFQFSLTVQCLYCVAERYTQALAKFHIQFALIVEVNRQCRHQISNVRRLDVSADR